MTSHCILTFLSLCVFSVIVDGITPPNFSSVLLTVDDSKLENETNNESVVTVPLLRHLGFTPSNFYSTMVSILVYMWGVRLEIVTMTEGYDECVYLNVENGTNGRVAVFNPIQWHISPTNPKRWFMHQSTTCGKQIPHDFFEGMMNVSLFINRTKSSRCDNATVINANVSWTLEEYYSLFFANGTEILQQYSQQTHIRRCLAIP
eukprot:PhF_6_TR15568/c0_g1_i1/m.24182